MKNFIQPGESINYSNAGSAISSGDAVVIGDRIGIASVDIDASTGTGNVQMEGVYSLDKTTTQTYAQGDQLFYDSSTGKITNVATGKTKAGYAFAAAESADTSCIVKLSAEPKVMPVQAASVAATAADAVVDLNLLIGKLKAAGLMANS